MKRIKKLGFCAVLAASLLLTSPIFGNQATDAAVQSYEDRMADAVRRQQEALDELERIRSEQSEAWYELGQYDQLISITESQKKLAEEQLDSIKAQIDAKTVEIAATAERIATQEDAFLKRMVSSYMEGDASYLELLLGAESLVDFLARLDRIVAIRESDRAIINQLKTDKENLLLAEQSLQEAKTLQQSAIVDFEAAIADTKNIYDTKAARLNQLANDEAGQLATYEYYRQLEQELDAELQKYLAELQKKAETVYVGGTMAWPLDPNAYYYCSSEFGWRTLYGQPDYHLGIDFACAQNTKILAANDGTVLKSEYHSSYGNYVLIDHGGGMATLYAHMTSRAVNVGDKVSMGQVIGYVGTTGNSTGNHLHFEVRKNGEVQQPRDYISGPLG